MVAIWSLLQDRKTNKEVHSGRTETVSTQTVKTNEHPCLALSAQRPVSSLSSFWQTAGAAQRWLCHRRSVPAVCGPPSSHLSGSKQMNSSMRLRNSGWKCLRTRSMTNSRTSGAGQGRRDQKCKQTQHNKVVTLPCGVRVEASTGTKHAQGDSSLEGRWPLSKHVTGATPACRSPATCPPSRFCLYAALKISALPRLLVRMMIAFLNDTTRPYTRQDSSTTASHQHADFEASL
jgi:hypothetical protein